MSDSSHDPQVQDPRGRGPVHGAGGDNGEPPRCPFCSERMVGADIPDHIASGDCEATCALRDDERGGA